MVSNKGVSSALGIIIAFFFVSAFFMFSFYLMKGIGDDYVIDPLHNISKDLGGDLNISTQMMNNFDTIKASYDSLIFPVDLAFLAFFLSSLAGSIWISVKAKRQPIFSFFGLLFIMIFFFLVLVSIVTQITSWIIDEIYLKVFADTIISTPIFDWVFTNMGIISFVWALIILLVNQWSRININGITGNGGEVIE